MHPILFEIGGFPVYTYGVLLAAAYLLGLQFALRRARTRGQCDGGGEQHGGSSRSHGRPSTTTGCPANVLASSVCTASGDT